MGSDDFWAIASYFNPAGYHRRAENFRRFREVLDGPLIVAEWSGSGRFEVTADDRTTVVRLSQGDVMWQKEALLNVALDHLPSTARYVAWLDCDILFEDRDWREQARRALDKSPIAQLFTDLHDLSPDGGLRPDAPAGISLAALHAEGVGPYARPGPAHAPGTRRIAYGFAWAARAQLLRRHRLYDAVVTGGGDRSIACAALGEWEQTALHQKLTPARTAHYVEWAKPFFQDIRGDVGVLPGRLFHLWHGEIANRGYGERHDRFAELMFDPSRDLVRDGGGLWKWAGQRPHLRQYMADYFAARREDG